MESFKSGKIPLFGCALLLPPNFSIGLAQAPHHAVVTFGVCKQAVVHPPEQPTPALSYCRLRFWPWLNNAATEPRNLSTGRPKPGGKIKHEHPCRERWKAMACCRKHDAAPKICPPESEKFFLLFYTYFSLMESEFGQS